MPARDEARAILILGAAVWPGAEASPTLSRRTATAADLWHSGVACVIVPCGGVGRHPPSEAKVMQRLLLQADVPPGAIHLEDKSKNTVENIAFAKRILDRMDIQSVIIVSDAYHLPRARLLARRAGLHVRSASPSLRGARPRTFLKGVIREVPAYLAAWIGYSRRG